jgi:hypothetical protein
VRLQLQVHLHSYLHGASVHELRDQRVRRRGADGADGVSQLCLVYEQVLVLVVRCEDAAQLLHHLLAQCGVIALC